MPFRALGLLSTLCTAFYALVGMLLRGGKTVEKREFCQIFSFYLLLFCTIRMFLAFTYLFSYRSEIRVCVDSSLDTVCSRRYGMRFSQMFWKNHCMDAIRYWRSRICFSFHGTSDSPPMKGYFVCRWVEGSWSSRKMLCMCVWGNVLASGERGFQE